MDHSDDEDYVPPYTLNLPWVEKYRPRKLHELVSHEEIVSTIQRFMDHGELPHLLFYGPPGTGKTSTIMACARQLYRSSQFASMVLELNASDDRGIGIVRGRILSFSSSKTIFSSQYKLVILDEADAMTNDAQNALRRVIEKYTENVRFCIICNYLGKIIPALQSRCTRFRFAPLSGTQIIPRLDHVIEKEGLKVSEEGKAALIRLGEGDMRKILNVLQSTHLAFQDESTLTEEHFHLCTGAPTPSDIKAIANDLLTLDISSCMKQMMKLKVDRGLALSDILTKLHEYIEKIDLPSAACIHLLSSMAEIEYRLSMGVSEKLQIASLVSTFFTVRDKIAEGEDEDEDEPEEVEM